MVVDVAAGLCLGWFAIYIWLSLDVCRCCWFCFSESLDCGFGLFAFGGAWVSGCLLLTLVGLILFICCAFGCVYCVVLLRRNIF